MYFIMAPFLHKIFHAAAAAAVVLVVVVVVVVVSLGCDFLSTADLMVIMQCITLTP
jgi:hypothetical protein